VSDQWLEPFVIVRDEDKPIGAIEDHDSVVIFNFRAGALFGLKVSQKPTICGGCLALPAYTCCAVLTLAPNSTCCCRCCQLMCTVCMSMTRLWWCPCRPGDRAVQGFRRGGL